MHLHRLLPLFTFSFLLFTSSASAAAFIPPLKSAAPHGLGPLTVDNVGFALLGSAFISNSTHQDIFLAGRGGPTDLWLCKYAGTTTAGAPVFQQPIRVKTPAKFSGAILQTPDNKVHALWIAKKEIILTTFDPAKNEFVETDGIPLSKFKLPKTPASIAAFLNPDNSLDLVFEIADNTAGRPGDAWAEDYRPYGADGTWTGGIPFRYLYTARLPAFFKGNPTNVQQATPSQRQVYMTMGQLTPANLGNNHPRALVSGSRNGNRVVFPRTNTGNSPLSFNNALLIAAPDGNAQRHPTINANPIAYQNPKTGLTDLIVSGEGPIYYYQATGNFTALGAPIYKKPTLVLQLDADLYTGSLPTPTTIDWDSDGQLDIIVGNSDGNILFFKNTRTTTDPKFLPGVPLSTADGELIQIEAGYSGSVQGLQEARWGYLSPNAIDWNQDGLPDILIGSITGDIQILINRGIPGKPKLDRPAQLYCDGLPLHGMWRVRPAAAHIKNPDGTSTTLLITVDDDDQFHLYHRIDDYNVRDIGPLKLKNGSIITASSGPGGMTGRCKLDLFDWDNDGNLDLVIGTCRSNAIPNKKTGYPKPTLGEKPMATALFMRNAGTNQSPVFEHTVPFTWLPTGDPIQPGGAHESGAIGTYLGSQNGLPNLLAGSESGRLYLYPAQSLKPSPQKSK